MPLTYVNRRGDTYYIGVRVPKTGKASYYATTKPKGVELDAVPDGYAPHLFQESFVELF
jgi:hypothetical protein